MKTIFVVKVISSEGIITDGYVSQEIDLPFLPTKDMHFKKGTSTYLWETDDDDELDPSIVEIVYDIDEETVYCLFEINKNLSSMFWNKIEEENLDSSYALSRFGIFTKRH